MPVGDIVGEVLSGVLRFAGQLVGELVLELLIRGPGYLLCKPFKRDLDPDAGLVVLVGLVFWITLGLAVWVIWPRGSS